jgi:hypothetical protein
MSVLLIPKSWPLYCTESLHLLAYHVKGAIQRDKRNISIVNPTRCTNFSNLFYFGITIHVSEGFFRQSSGDQDCTYSNRYKSNRC